ncbi:unnamed protein product [Meloidogyne enterolobii]|uniref:Uncharacterized protein n=1 Tax=Meloidogyne enterolobii TaxID=390850 RepID=A0ACB1AXS9_MELEN
MVLISEKCANILSCPIKSLRDNLNHPENRKIILNSIKGKKVRTTYNDKNGLKKTFVIEDLSEEGANILQAYGRLSKPFNICVAAHYYAKHRIRLQYPYLHCIVEKFPTKKGVFKENRYYPLELLELINEDEPIQNRENNISKREENKQTELVVVEDEEENEQLEEILKPTYYCNGW